MAYAESTTVPVDRSQGEIRKLLSKYRATGFAIGETKELAMIQFEMNGKRIKFTMPLPIAGVTRGGPRNYVMSQTQLEQEMRRLWRCLILSIKSKLESVESKITTFEQEFMAHIVLPGGKTAGEVILPEIEYSYQHGTMPPLLGMRPE